MEGENTFNNIEEVLNQIPENYKIMEETIDLETQKDYFESTKNLVIDPDIDKLDELISQIDNPEIPVDELKVILIKLGLIDAVEAFRAIEKYYKHPHPELKEWALLSLQQSRMVLQSSLMGEQQVFISTGLGGKENKLRYYMIFPYNEVTVLDQLQTEALKSELHFFMERNEGIIEETEFQQEFATAMILLPIKANIPEIVKQILAECNQLGNFLSDDVLITNMKRFSHDEILEILEKYEQKED